MWNSSTWTWTWIYFELSWLWWKLVGLVSFHWTLIRTGFWTDLKMSQDILNLDRLESLIFDFDLTRLASLIWDLVFYLELNHWFSIKNIDPRFSCAHQRKPFKCISIYIYIHISAWIFKVSCDILDMWPTLNWHLVKIDLRFNSDWHLV